MGIEQGFGVNEEPEVVGEKEVFQETAGKERKNEMVIKLGSELHDEWREPRKREDGFYEPRIKSTKDEEWIKKNGVDEVDIANTSFENLPVDWQKENKIAAEVAVGEVFKANKNNQKMDDNFIEEASSVVHEKWLERNGEWANEELKKTFKELSEEEKDKDRAQVRKAIEVFLSQK
jgi:hypothetical protein